ncbi:hypothetical protein [Aeoliella sp.]|uniref:hypothetical protein n=1 Tax=Aeoliella sp. TaxID=2795800 RepID=UPI003CCB8A0F
MNTLSPNRFAILCITALVSLGCTQENPPTRGGPLKGPITVKLENVGSFAEGESWSLELDADRIVHLNIGGYPSDNSRVFQITRGQVEELRDLLIEQDFFALDDEYGELVSSGSEQTMTVTCGEQSHTVKLHFLMNWARFEPDRLRDPARAVRVWRLIRDWFDDEEAADLRRYDDMVLNAAPAW